MEALDCWLGDIVEDGTVLLLHEKAQKPWANGQRRSSSITEGSPTKHRNLHSCAQCAVQDLHTV